MWEVAKIQAETKEQKDARKSERRKYLEKMFAESLEVMLNPEIDLEWGILIVTRERPGGELETISDLLVMEITEDGPNLAMIDNEGNPSASATMLWEEITEVELKWLIPKKGKENLIEHIPTPEEVLALFKELAGGEDFETKRKLEDEEGLLLWDITLPDKDGSGGSVEYLYIRKGDHSKKGLTGSMGSETMINKVFVNADGLPIHGYLAAKLAGDKWKIIP